MVKLTIGGAIVPALTLLPAKFSSPEALVLLVAIGLQESGLVERVQIVQGGGKGPARGLWQFERGGGVAGVLKHPATATLAADVCRQRGVDPTVTSVVWGELASDDVLAAAFARLLLYTDPAPLPRLGDESGAWSYYVRNWRPGKPHRDRWGPNYVVALGEVA